MLEAQDIFFYKSKQVDQIEIEYRLCVRGSRFYVINTRKLLDRIENNKEF